jgi:hypothetical protein
MALLRIIDGAMGKTTQARLAAKLVGRAQLQRMNDRIL